MIEDEHKDKDDLERKITNFKKKRSCKYKWKKRDISKK